MKKQTINIKHLIHEDFVNYKKPSMFIGMGTCDWKCCKEGGSDNSICQNSALAQSPNIEIDLIGLADDYMSNYITESVVIGGLEPFTDFETLLRIVQEFRQHTNDDIVIYTGYYAREIIDQLIVLSDYDNIILKFGRYVPNDEQEKLDPVLGVKLSSSNQFGAKLVKGSSDILEAIKQNEGYCPCFIAKNDKTRCCCHAFKNSSEGKCHCGAFEK